MIPSFRWFGPTDPIPLAYIRQIPGVRGVVSALYDVPVGDPWRRERLGTLKGQIEDAELCFAVVESIPVHEDIKLGRPARDRLIEHYCTSVRSMGELGVPVLCYNFMPVVDWCRTDLEWELPNGAKAMRFDQERFAAFDLHILERPEAPAEYSEAARRRAKEVYSGMTQADIDVLVTNIASALPGSTTDPLTIPQFRDRLQQYRGIDSAVLRQHLSEFLARVTPVAESLGVTLTLHPDDPPRPLFGLPRIASSAEDYQALFDAVPSKANGICFCTGSLGVRAENDLPAMAKRFAPRIGFAHLRATKREGDGLSFFESDHLDGDVDMIAVLKALLTENRKRSSSHQVVFRPDHGHRMLDDLAETKRTNPGYTAIGRLRGLAELRGAIRAIEHTG